jgi:hypothetical protein
MRTSARAGNMANKAKTTTKKTPTTMRPGSEGFMDFTSRNKLARYGRLSLQMEGVI